jgi:hypothetical protein
VIEIPQCKVCGTNFDNIFDAINHLIEDDEEIFEPVYQLPSGYALMLGSLLEELYHHADEPDIVRQITEITYATLYAAQTDTVKMKDLVHQAIINQHMSSIDEELKDLLEEDDNGNDD